MGFNITRRLNGNALETEDGKGLLPVHFGFETTFSPLLGCTPPANDTPSYESSTGDGSRDSSYSEDDWCGHLGESAGG